MEFHHFIFFFFLSNVCHECVARYFPSRFTEGGQGKREREKEREKERGEIERNNSWPRN